MSKKTNITPYEGITLKERSRLNRRRRLSTHHSGTISLTAAMVYSLVLKSNKPTPVPSNLKSQPDI